MSAEQLSEVPRAPSPADGAAQSGGSSPRTAGGRAVAFLLKYAMVWVLVGLAVLATALFPAFLTLGNLNDLFGQIAPVAIVAVGMTYVIIGGGFDLSVSATFAGSAVAYASLSNSHSLPVAFVGTIVLALVVGLLNGLIITLMKVNTFIATLASASLISGATYVYSNATPVISTNPDFQTLGTGQWHGVWNSIYVLVVITAIGGFALSRTVYGRFVHAVGGNLEAARLAGIRTKAVRVSTFMVSAACAAVGGTIVASQTGIGQANIGANITLDSIAIVIIGGTSLLGGVGAMWRTAVGVLIWATITNLFSTLALSTSAQLFLQGGIVLVAVGIDSLSRRELQ